MKWPDPVSVRIKNSMGRVWMLAFLVVALSAEAAALEVDGNRQALDGEEQSLLAQVNAYRRSIGLTEVESSPTLNNLAWCRAKEISQDTVVTHDTEECTEEREAYLASEAWALGEDLAWGCEEADRCLELWKESPEHDRILTLDGFASAGIARVLGEDGVWVWVLLLGDQP